MYNKNILIDETIPQYIGSLETRKIRPVLSNKTHNWLLRLCVIKKINTKILKDHNSYCPLRIWKENMIDMLLVNLTEEDINKYLAEELDFIKK